MQASRELSSSTHRFLHERGAFPLRLIGLLVGFLLMECCSVCCFFHKLPLDDFSFYIYMSLEMRTEPYGLFFLIAVTSLNLTAPIPVGDRPFVPARIPCFSEL